MKFIIIIRGVWWSSEYGSEFGSWWFDPTLVNLSLLINYFLKIYKYNPHKIELFYTHLLIFKIIKKIIFLNVHKSMKNDINTKITLKFYLKFT